MSEPEAQTEAQAEAQPEAQTEAQAEAQTEAQAEAQTEARDAAAPRVLFVSLMERGHINPLIGVLQALQREGAALACYGLRRGAIAEQLAAAGVACAWFPTEDGGAAAAASGLKTQHLRERGRLLRWCALGVAACLDARSVEGVRAAIRAFQPDVVCVDPMAYHGCAAAELEGVPWAALSPLLVAALDRAWRCDWLDVMTELHPMIQELLAARGVAGLRLDGCDAISPWLNTVFVTEDFAPRRWSGNRRSFYVGPSRPLGRRGDEADFPWERLRSDVPIVYLSSGGGHSLRFGPDEVRAICRSLTEEEAQLVCALQALAGTEVARELPASAIVVPYAPQEALLQRHAAVAVTHGGVNSVSECLTHGRPMLVVPLGLEQALQARAVVERGVGLTMDSEELGRRGCRQELLRLLDPAQGFAGALEPVRRSYAENGALRAAELILTLARTRAPLLPPLGDEV